MSGEHVVIGAGPAGLTAAWQLARAGERVTVLEQDPRYVGGLARSFLWGGARFDVGPHRFYTKSPEIERAWQTMLPGGFVPVGRLTRIWYRGRFFRYPIEIGDVLRNLGAWRSARVLASWLRARATPWRPVRSFEDWVVQRFGRELYRTFFKTYTEKVWGIPCASIDKDWAAQRIRGLSLAAVVRAALGLRPRRGVKSLVGKFVYPRGGAGALWDRVRDEVVARGVKVRLGSEVVALRHADGRVTEVVARDGGTFAVGQCYATLTLRALLEALDPPPPAEVLAAGRRLRHRDFVVVALVVGATDLFPDQWVYVHDPQVRVARITNFENWGESGGQVAGHSRLVLEYFANRDEPLWREDDAALVRMAARELAAIGLVRDGVAVTGTVVRIADAYPVYDAGYRERRTVVRDWLRATFTNLHPAGRHGLHNYNSQDHAMLSALRCVANALEGARNDVWAINTEEEYAEERDGAAGERLVPRRL